MKGSPWYPGAAWRRLLAAAGMLALSACAGDDDRIVQAMDDAPEYQLAVGDEVRVRVFDHQDISGEYDINSKGEITFPLLRSVDAEGLTVEQLRTRIEKGLNETYLVDARVTVEILNYRPIYVLGEVRTPGSYSYQPGLTVHQIIATAGGFTRRAVTDSVTLRRQTRRGTRTFEVPKSTPVRPGDMIEVDRRLF